MNYAGESQVQETGFEIEDSGEEVKILQTVSEEEETGASLKARVIGPKMQLKKPSFEPKRSITDCEILDEERGVIRLTKEESEKRLGEYVSVMIMNKLKSQKWESKVLGIEWLQEWLIFNNTPSTLLEYAFRYLKGIMKEWKETNPILQKAVTELIMNVLLKATRLGKRSISKISKLIHNV